MHSRVIVALDNMSLTDSMALASQLDPGLCKLKVGKELFTRNGPIVVENLANKGFDVFLDLKFHDIPNTVANACKAAADLGVWMLNVHASGGRKMMIAAREALRELNTPPLLIAVTILTSLDDQDLAEIGYRSPTMEQVKRLATLAAESGLNGVVCSPLESATIKTLGLKDFSLVTPGIRPKDSNIDDQSRIQTPAQAIQSGSSYLVIGRPITRSKDPIKTLLSINEEIKNA